MLYQGRQLFIMLFSDSIVFFFLFFLEIICPFEKFELELMKNKDSFWSPDDEREEYYEDAKDTISSNLSKYSDATMMSDCDA